ncbi:hypothetical protein Pla175_03430 [Pirellulimonas nuda]|uniref:Uncharacterized protein n=1 Tax=Pirellulimonas nuda TaxID=2528009 RepID=A0A518D6A6_9BACT|nr:hypothetical protein Pla175_03430 [Pirellulimonas nuda]
MSMTHQRRQWPRAFGSLGFGHFGPHFLCFLCLFVAILLSSERSVIKNFAASCYAALASVAVPSAGAYEAAR